MLVELNAVCYVNYKFLLLAHVTAYISLIVV